MNKPQREHLPPEERPAQLPWERQNASGDPQQGDDKGKAGFLVSTLIALVVGALLTVAILYMRGFWQIGRTAAQRWGIASDAFFASGVVLAGMGLLSFITKQGQFDIIVYGFSNFVSFFYMKPRDKSERKYADFDDYRRRKAAARKDRWFLVAAGGVYIALAVISLLIHSNGG